MADQIVKNWHNIEVEEVFQVLTTNQKGLTQEEAERRLATFGPNELVEKKKMPWWALYLEQFKNILIIILLIGAVLSAVLGEIPDAIVIFVIVIFASTLGFVQEFRAEKAMEALKKMAAPTATVLRDGKQSQIPSREIVPGDIVLLHTGDKIPADARLIEVVNLKTEEAPLTGESVAVEKIGRPVEGGTNVGDRRNMAFAGTNVVYGRSSAVVTATGMSTEFGKIATMLQTVEHEQTPLQINLDRMSKTIAIGALFLCFLLAAVGLLRWWQAGVDIWPDKVLEMAIWGISLAIAAVPEALPAVVTISLSLGVQKMVKHHALIRKLPAVETLGCTTYICSDKTGTLTQDQMTIRRIYVDGRSISVSGSGYEPKGDLKYENGQPIPDNDPAVRTLVMAGSLCNDALLENNNGVWKIKGDPTEGSLIVLAAKTGLQRELVSNNCLRIHEIPFTSESKRMTTIHKADNGHVAYSKGAVEVILDASTHIFSEGKEREITSDDRAAIVKVAHTMAGDALRVLGLSYKCVPEFKPAKSGDVESGMVFIGVVGMVDPPRPEVKDSIAECNQAGIKSVMITGDHKLTAVAIGRELGLLKNGMSVSGEELDKISDVEFEKQVENIEVYARVSPAHKLRVVEALTKKGHVVAMTGDGVNDAPALKKADIGIAMGITGTDVTKEAADMILTDDNFASIVAAVREGRGIFSNIKKYLVYLLSCNLGEIILMAAVILFGSLLGMPPIPLIPIQILYVNLATDGLPALALSVEPAEPGIMKEKPRMRNQTIFTKPVLTYLGITGIWTAIVTFGVFTYATLTGNPAEEAQTMCFVTLIFVEFFNALNCRSFDRSIFQLGFFSNKWLMMALFWELCLLGVIVYVPALQGPFNTYALTLQDWLICIFSASTIFIFVEIYKLVRRHLVKSN